MQRIVAGITALEEHVEAIRETPEVYRPKCCPHCGVKEVHRHGSYERKADRGPTLSGLNPIRILRYRCTQCRHTCSRLPECIPPRRWYLWSVQQRVLQQRIDGTPAQLASTPDRRTAVRWWNWLQERGENFAFRLRARFADLGRAVDSDGFWLQVFERLGLSQAMFWLDQEIRVP